MPLKNICMAHETLISCSFYSLPLSNSLRLTPPPIFVCIPPTNFFSEPSPEYQGFFVVCFVLCLFICFVLFCLHWQYSGLIVGSALRNHSGRAWRTMGCWELNLGWTTFKTSTVPVILFLLPDLNLLLST